MKPWRFAEIVMAKSKGIGRGGKRKVAGRPRFMKTGKASYISIRITQETRDLVEAEARKSGKSLATIAEDLLRMGLEVKTDRREGKTERALVFLIKHLMLAIGTGAGGLDWRSNPYTMPSGRPAMSSNHHCRRGERLFFHSRMRLRITVAI
jgi:hypothetical protein